MADGDCPPNPTGSNQIVTAPTRCDRDRVRNVWIEGGNPETGEDGVCLLDTLIDEQVIYILERDDKARQDLVRVTSDEHLLDLAVRVMPLSTAIEGDEEQKLLNKDTIPFYTAFRGQPPFAQ